MQGLIRNCFATAATAAAVCGSRNLRSARLRARFFAPPRLGPQTPTVRRRLLTERPKQHAAIFLLLALPPMARVCICGSLRLDWSRRFRLCSAIDRRERSPPAISTALQGCWRVSRACICGSLTGVVTGMSCPFFGSPVKLEFDPGAVGVSTVWRAARAGSGATRLPLSIRPLLCASCRAWRPLSDDNLPPPSQSLPRDPLCIPLSTADPATAAVGCSVLL